MNELFKIEPIKSPRLKWMERHHLSVAPNVLEGGPKFIAKHGMSACGIGETHNDALVSAAKSLNIKLWNEDTL